MTGPLLTFLALSCVIILAGLMLARFADELGEQLGFERTISGVLLLATATSLPELAVSAHAAMIPAPDLAVGDMLGSCLFNLLILAVLDMFHQKHGSMFSRTAAAHALSATASIALCAIVIVFVLVDLPWFPIRVGPGSVFIALGYIASMRLIYFDQHFGRAVSEKKPKPADAESPSLAWVLGGYLVATAIILVTAPALARTSDQLATVTGLGGTFVGTVFVALATSLPEVSTTFQALRMGAGDLAIGNILGSNCFNILAIAGVDLFFAGDLLASISDVHAVTAACAIIATSAGTLGLLFRAEKRLWIIEPDALLVILLIVASLVLVYVAG